ncbi:NlpC/P60 family protein [Pontibacter qinzhouensis]|uniref:NlpC/P60 family protein n=2 Tax=Pontibacter qinzhouensis TaxID=2603253 RepID=A0A5C8IZR6_9BACT|nr:NlpC/P60 family protein [Pontibacter qinzhouensis]
MRAEPADRAEQVSQLLFGECYTILNTQGNWLQVELATDRYRGWIDQKQHTPVTAAYFQEWKESRHPRVLDLLQVVKGQEAVIPVGIGNYLPFFDGQHLRLNEQLLQFNGRAANAEAVSPVAELVQVALSFLKAPYQWGGKSVFGVDCSGFVQQVYGVCGYQLPRDAYQQVEAGEEVHFVAQTQPGDLAFFSNAEGRIIHVGLLLENQQIIHAHGEIRIDTLDHQGIYQQDRKRYSHQLRIIKRIING